ncbi:MAG: signal peptidase I [Marinobacter sp.]|uniref:signal peptidase I n=1 Tax=Marinobacter sp. TaxID=50741 RepID=UPI0029C39225|nr:signal peptidase I [Marinobacter sp.]MDX5337074.1 signal peptidase I [Marinobacter sp.]MDX5388309.1 signal peptidase I [Marinobacter sp.]MDX5441593.1 signal peptidase I [Alteromonadaceae bacterium]MDX5473548.1 signal peptidase I [Marinobacter sp.]
MDIDFPLVLVVLTFATGLIWLADKVFFSKRRQAASPDVGGAASDDTAETSEPWLVDLSRSFFPVLAIVLVLRSFLVEPFQIPSGSMLPTLEVGDFILVNKYAYGLRLPVAGTKVVSMGNPERGDVMVFRYPEDGATNYIKRVIGLPGDRVRYRDKQLFINDEPVAREFVARLPPMERWREEVGGVEYDVYLTLGRVAGNGEGEWLVPDGHYFVMGDNRDNSNDSRFWGTVPDELVVGKAFAIWMHWKSLTSLPSFDRVGSID